ncbi:MULTISPECIES: AAA family ATPase [Leptospira]|uniref:AAA family ATPase n=1 Tax=Leptospira TaxID=171 RepID=UPI000774C280|nr:MULTISPECIES: AAA family ATPase [Leptospira]WOT11033.1 AAA family ATPase [Leptospira interrogans]
MNEEKSLILLRGLPGAGKSRLAKLLSENGKYPVFSVDDYFTDSKTQEYNFDYKKNHFAYKHCEDCVRKEAERGTSKIFSDNTFTLSWEMEPYFQIASEFEYTIFVITVENYHNGKNVHSIDDESLKKMASKYKIRLLPEILSE